MQLFLHLNKVVVFSISLFSQNTDVNILEWEAEIFTPNAVTTQSLAAFDSEQCKWEESRSINGTLDLEIDILLMLESNPFVRHNII